MLFGTRAGVLGSYGYGVTYADCDEHYLEAPTWCAATADAETGSARVALPPRPACWREMVDVARALGAAAGVFTRVDLYASTSSARVFTIHLSCLEYSNFHFFSHFFRCTRKGHISICMFEAKTSDERWRIVIQIPSSLHFSPSLLLISHFRVITP